MKIEISIDIDVADNPPTRGECQLLEEMIDAELTAALEQRVARTVKLFDGLTSPNIATSSRVTQRLTVIAL